MATIALPGTTIKPTSDRMEMTGQGGASGLGSTLHAAGQCNGYRSIPVTVPLPTVKGTFDRIEMTGRVAAGAVQWVTIVFKVPTSKVTGDRMLMTGKGGLHHRTLQSLLCCAVP